MLQSIKWKIFLEVFIHWDSCKFSFLLSSKYCCVPQCRFLKAQMKMSNFVWSLRCKTHFLVLKNDFPHAEVEHGADVDDEEEGADHGESQDGGAGGTGVRLRHWAEHLLTGPGPVYCIHFEVCHWGKHCNIRLHYNEIILKYYIRIF